MKTLLSATVAFALTTFSAFATPAQTTESNNVETYKIDATHSSVTFSIRHFVAKTTGNFTDFEGTLVVDRDNLANSSAEVVIRVPSVDTDNEKRDSHLQEDEYFGTASHPLMVFKSTQWEATQDQNQFKVTGDLQIRGITREVSLHVKLLGFGNGMNGAYLSGWEGTTTLDRTDWGVNGGQPAVGDEVDVTINIEAVRQ